MTTPAAAPNLDEFRDQQENNKGAFTPADPDNPLSTPNVDTDTGGDFLGTHLDPDSEAGKSAAPDASEGRIDNSDPIPGQEQKSYKQENQRGEPGNYGKHQREGIYKNASDQREARINPEATDLDPERLAAMQAEAAGGTSAEQNDQPLINAESIAAANAALDVANAELEASGGDPAGKTVLPSELVRKSDQDLDLDTTLVKIAVDGEEQFATLGEVIEAGGVDILQKDRAANMRLELAATQGRSLNARDKALTEREQQLGPKIREAVIKALGEEATTTGDVPIKDRPDLDGAESVSDMIYRGNTDEGDAGLVKLIKKVAGQLTNTQAAGGDPSVDTRVQKVLDEIGITIAPDPETTPTPAAGTRTAEETAANAVYKDRFPDVIKAAETRPEVLQAATRRMSYLRTLPENDGRSLAELAVEAGNSVRHQYLTPDGANVIPSEQLQEVISRKRKTPMPTRVQGTVQAPEVQVNQTRAQRTKNAFDSIAKARGQRV